MLFSSCSKLLKNANTQNKSRDRLNSLTPSPEKRKKVFF